VKVIQIILSFAVVSLLVGLGVVVWQDQKRIKQSNELKAANARAGKAEKRILELENNDNGSSKQIPELQSKETNS